MLSFRDLRLILKNGGGKGLPVIRIAIVGDTATQFLTTALKGMAIACECQFDVYEADYNQVELQLLDIQSGLHQFNPKYVVIFQSSQKLLESYYQMADNEKETLADKRIALVRQLCGATSASVIYFNYPFIDDGVFGSYSSKVSSSFPFQIRQLNYKLMECSKQIKNLFLLDLDSLQQRYGRKWLFDASTYTNTEMVLSIEALPYVASRCVDIIQSLEGRFKKCIILDLDNTLWGGIIGDDGLENLQLGHGLGIGKCFTNFQFWLKQLEKRGIIICICSKNDEAVAKSPFEKHPEMVLRLDDIAIFMANWDNKADNIRRIQKILNIGFDSMVFVDDNPFERNLVRENIPGIAVPELPQDPSDYVDFLVSLNLFETASYNTADQSRNKQYQIEAQRVSYAQNFTDEKSFLENLEMQAGVDSFTTYNIPRVAQLSQRSNQFNLRTVRYSEGDVIHISKDPDYKGFAFTLKDKFGDNGLISVVILHKESVEKYFVETFFMSCRVLKRGMESFVLNIIVDWVKGAGGRYIIGEYIPTAKNKMVEHLYTELGFDSANEQGRQLYVLDVNAYDKRETFITLV